MSDFASKSLTRREPVMEPDAIIDGRDVITENHAYFGVIPPAADPVPVTRTTGTGPSGQPGVDVLCCPADEPPCCDFIVEPP